MQTISWDRNPIRSGGCYYGIPLDLYHSASICDDKSVSSSGLRAIYAKSPAHYFAESPYCQRAADEPVPEERAAQAMGRMAHHLIVGAVGKPFAEEFVIRPTVYPETKTKPWNGNSNECKRWLAAQSKAGRTVVTEDQVRDVKGMALSLSRHPLIAGEGGLLDGLVEQSLFWTDTETGVWLKARPDVIPTTSGDVCDLKTTRSTLWTDLTYSLEKWGYHQQAALIGDGIKAVFGLQMASFSLVWVEKSRPYCVRVTPISGDDIQRGRLQNRVALRRFADCAARGRWPGPEAYDSVDEFAMLRLSNPARERADARLKIEGMI